jgi:diguanylate cyclase (GGDEF)-like protein/PAS domain S-box-containing protein
MWQITPITIGLTLATLLNLLVTLLAWQRRQTKLGQYFAYAMLGISIWTLAAGLGYTAVPLSWKIFFATIETWGYMSAMPLLTLVAMLFAGNIKWAEKTPVKALLLFISITSILLVTTNGLHGWVWDGFVESNNNVVIFEHGPAFQFIAISGYVLIGVILLHLLVAVWKGSLIARRQGIFLLAATLLPVAANLAYHAALGGMAGVDWTSVTYSITAAIYLWALTGPRLLDLIPIARRQLLDNLTDGMIALDKDGRIVDTNATVSKMLNIEQPPPTGSSINNLLPMAAELLTSPPEVETRREIQIPQAPNRYFELGLSPIRDEHQQIIGRLLVLSDITLRKEKELRLLQLTQAVEQSPVSVFITDLNANILYVNPRFTALTGYSQEEVLGRNARMFQSGQTSTQTYREMWQTLLAGQIWHGEFLNSKKNGELYWESAVIGPVLDEGRKILNFIATKQDITEQKLAQSALQNANTMLAEQLEEIKTLQASLKEQVIRDPLTQLYNRRFLHEILEQEFLQAERIGQSVSIVLVDIDHFKRINDIYGHSAGDACLITLANYLQDTKRRADICFRYGGEEFLILLPNTSLEGALHYAEALRKGIEQWACHYDDQTIMITASLGVATFPIDGDSDMQIINRADEALYAAKKEGRNRVTAWQALAS